MHRAMVCCGVLLLVGLALPAAGSTFVAMDETELLTASDAVVLGRVVSVDSFWNERHTLIVTEAVLEVERVVVGSAPAYLTLRTAGGTVDGVTVEATGFPTFEPGERSLLFLERDDDRPLGRVSTGGRPEGYRVAGYQLGHYRVAKDRVGDEIAVPTADPGINMLSLESRRAERPRVRKLDRFVEHLRLRGRQLKLSVPLR